PTRPTRAHFGLSACCWHGPHQPLCEETRLNLPSVLLIPSIPPVLHAHGRRDEMRRMRGVGVCVLGESCAEPSCDTATYGLLHHSG
ncbi:uncharacterized, partial [Tachysurus ichikawai]